jgi:hypothetical protein
MEHSKKNRIINNKEMGDTELTRPEKLPANEIPQKRVTICPKKN